MKRLIFECKIPAADNKVSYRRGVITPCPDCGHSHLVCPNCGMDYIFPPEEEEPSQTFCQCKAIISWRLGETQDIDLIKLWTPKRPKAKGFGH
jgi:hypothetical protein